jgi:hypothetical protein
VSEDTIVSAPATRFYFIVKRNAAFTNIVHVGDISGVSTVNGMPARPYTVGHVGLFGRRFLWAIMPGPTFVLRCQEATVRAATPAAAVQGVRDAISASRSTKVSAPAVFGLAFVQTQRDLLLASSPCIALAAAGAAAVLSRYPLLSSPCTPLTQPPRALLRVSLGDITNTAATRSAATPTAAMRITPIAATPTAAVRSTPIAATPTAAMRITPIASTPTAAVRITPTAGTPTAATAPPASAVIISRKRPLQSDGNSPTSAIKKSSGWCLVTDAQTPYIDCASVMTVNELAEREVLSVLMSATTHTVASNLAGSSSRKTRVSRATFFRHQPRVARAVCRVTAKLVAANAAAAAARDHVAVSCDTSWAKRRKSTHSSTEVRCDIATQTFAELNCIGHGCRHRQGVVLHCPEQRPGQARAAQCF